jgi:hypothetical protein
MKLQLSAEILIGMAVTLLVVLALLGYFANIRGAIVGTWAALSAVANAVSSYPARLPAG